MLRDGEGTRSKTFFLATMMEVLISTLSSLVLLIAISKTSQISHILGNLKIDSSL